MAKEKSLVVNPVFTEPDWFNRYRGIMEEINRQLETGEMTLDALQANNEHTNYWGVIPGWMKEMIIREGALLQVFFGQEFDLMPFVETLRHYGRKRINIWRKLGMEPHFLPEVLMSAEAIYPGWKIKPEKWFYQMSDQGKLFLLQPDGSLVVSNPAYQLGGITVLIDTRCKPAYNNGQQIYAEDKLLGSIIEDLRKQQKIQDYSPRNSRFNISGNECEVIKSVLAAKIGLKPEQVRLETEIEANVIPQLYADMPRQKDGTTNTSEWREEFFESRGYRLHGGLSVSGGLADVRCHGAGSHWSFQGVRFLAVL